MSNTMREILFRGERKDNGEWVYGAYGNHTPLDAVIMKRPYISINGKLSTLNFWEVDPDTVGQYTGLTDKNGKKIFEGDIVDYNGTKHEVVFETRASAYFGIKISHIETWQFCLEVPAKLMEVVGNIHDNPELLEVSNE